VLELHYGLARDDTETGALAELRDEFFSNAVGEEFAIGIAGKVGERKNSNGLNARCAGDESGEKTAVVEKEEGGGERRKEEKGSEKSEERFAAEKGVRWSGSKWGKRDSVGRGIALQAPKINGEFLCGLIAVGRILFETLGEDMFELEGQLRIELTRRNGRAMEYGVEQFAAREFSERTLTGGHFVEDEAGGVEISATIKIAAKELFRSHIGKRADD